MAHAQNNTKVETITQTTGSVELSLSLFEARFLRQLMGYIGGSPTVSARRHAESISRALHDASVQGGGYIRRLDHPRRGGAVYFEDQPEVLNAER